MALPHGDKRKLEVAIMMALEPHVFMFDEPTAGMSVDDVPVILDLIKALKGAGDKTILLVEHKMDVVKSLADRIVVLHNGRLVADGEPAEVIGSAVVQEAYLGVRQHGAASRMAEALLTLEGVHTHIGQYHILQGVDFEVPRGAMTVLLGPQRRRQDHDAADHHGTVEAERRQGDVRRPRHRRDGHARHRARRHRLRAGDHGRVRRPHRAGEHGPRRPERAAGRGAARLDVRVLPGAEALLDASRPACCRAGRSRCCRLPAPSSSRAA